MPEIDKHDVTSQALFTRSFHHYSRDEVGPWGTSRGLYANTIPSLGASFACWRRRVWVKMDVVSKWRFRLGSFDPEIQETSQRCLSDTAIH